MEYFRGTCRVPIDTYIGKACQNQEGQSNIEFERCYLAQALKQDFDLRESWFLDHSDKYPDFVERENWYSSYLDRFPGCPFVNTLKEYIATRIFSSKDQNKQ